MITKREFVLQVLVFSGCGQAQTNGLAQCVPGASPPCACADGRTGAQICQLDEVFGPCVCTLEGGGTAQFDGGVQGVDVARHHWDAGSPTGDAIADAAHADAAASTERIDDRRRL